MWCLVANPLVQCRYAVDPTLILQILQLLRHASLPSQTELALDLPLLQLAFCPSRMGKNNYLKTSQKLHPQPTFTAWHAQDMSRSPPEYLPSDRCEIVHHCPWEVTWSWPKLAQTVALTKRSPHYNIISFVICNYKLQWVQKIKTIKSSPSNFDGNVLFIFVHRIHLPRGHHE